jgi:hypothetical protein
VAEALVPTVISACSMGNWTDCGFVAYKPPTRADLLELSCCRPAAYVAKSRGYWLPNHLEFLVCVEHAPEVRLMDWLASLRTYHPLVGGSPA